MSPGGILDPHDPKNGFKRLPGYENSRLKKKLELSPKEKKLVLLYQERGQKFQMAAMARSYGGFLGIFFILKLGDTEKPFV